MSGAAYLTALDAITRAHVVWVEIGGLPVGYGTDALGSGWFATRTPAKARLTSVRPWLARDALPDSLTTDLDDAQAVVTVSALDLSIVDYDDTIAGLLGTRRTDQWLRLTADLSATASSVVVTGDLAAWPTSGVAYIGQETVTYTGVSGATTAGGTLTGLTRGMYGSPATVHDGPSLGSDGAVLSRYPRMIEGRRLRVMAGVNASSEADCAVVWQGGIEGVSFDSALRVLRIGGASGYGALRKGIYWRIGQWGAADRIAREVVLSPAVRALRPDSAADATAIEVSSGVAWPLVESPPESVDLTRGRRVDFLLAGWAPYYSDADGISAANTLTAQYWRGSIPDQVAADHGGWLTAPISSDPAAAERAYASLVDRIAQPLVEAAFIGDLYADAFGQAAPVTLGSVATAHPLIWCLAHLQAGLAVHASNADAGKYAGMLPEDAGLSLSNGEVDVAEFERLARLTPDLVVRGCVSEPIESAGDWLRDAFLRPFGFFLRTNLDGQLSVGWIREATPDTIADAVTITDADVLRDGIGEWTTDGSDVVGQVVVDESWWVKPGSTEQIPYQRSVAIVRGDDGEPVVSRFPRAQTVEVASRLTGLGGSTPGMAQRIADRLSSRRGDATARLSVTVGLRFLGVDVGDLVDLTLARVPDQQTGSRGVTETLWEVVSRTLDLRGARLTLRLRQSAFGRLGTRYYAPALLVTSWAGGSVLNVDTDEYSDGGADTGAFAVGARVRAYDAAFGARSTVRTIASKTASSVTLNSVAGISAGAVLVLSDYADGTASQADAGSAYRAARNETLTSSTPATRAAHVHG
jgi:hypothetical protein